MLESGDVVFDTDLVKMKVSEKNAERIFEKAINVLEGNIPEAVKGCQFCGWDENRKNRPFLAL